MNNSGFSRHTAPLAVPAAISKRQRCTACSRFASCGQFPVGSDVCIRCRPMPAGWRRGELEVVQFKGVV